MKPTQQPLTQKKVLTSKEILREMDMNRYPNFRLVVEKLSHKEKTLEQYEHLDTAKKIIESKERDKSKPYEMPLNDETTGEMGVKTPMQLNLKKEYFSFVKVISAPSNL